MRKLSVALAAAAASMLIGVMPAAASCRPPIPIAQALRDSDSVFVGTVEGIAAGGRTATFAVGEVWRGPDLPANVVVQGGPGGNGATSIDRTWEAGGRYLVFASAAEGRLADNACSNTQLWSEELTALRPSDVRQPSADEDRGGTGVSGPLLALIAAIGLIGVVGFVAFRSRPRNG
jgi:hypothetical protein